MYAARSHQSSTAQTHAMCLLPAQKNVTKSYEPCAAFSLTTTTCYQTTFRASRHLSVLFGSWMATCGRHLAASIFTQASDRAHSPLWRYPQDTQLVLSPLNLRLHHSEGVYWMRKRRVHMLIGISLGWVVIPARCPTCMLGRGFSVKTQVRVWVIVSWRQCACRGWMGRRVAGGDLKTLKKWNVGYKSG